MTDIWIVFAIIAVVIALFVWDRLPVIAVCIGCAMALWATGILTLNESHDVAIAELLQFGASDEAIDRVERDFQLRRDQIRHDALRGVLCR